MASVTAGKKRHYSSPVEEANVSDTIGQTYEIGDRICYGALYDTRAQCINGLDLLPDQFKDSENTTSFVYFPVKRCQGSFCLFSVDGTAFAIADQLTQDTLAALRQVPNTLFEAVLGTTAFSKRRKALARKSPVLEDISINVFGPQDDVVANEVAKRLSKVSAFLQHPKALRPEVIYRNPQFFVVPGEQINFDDLIGVSCDSLGLSNLRARVRGEVDSIFESLNVVSVEEATPLVHPNSLKARLTSHQEQAVRFMLDREKENPSDDNALCETYSSCSMQLKTNCGGLIADVMGMGKTLSTLVTILHTLQSAVDFADFTFRQADHKTPTRATLVVVPSRQLIDNWQSEIERHMSEALRVTIFHGEQKPRGYKTLMDTDLVITTYSTLASDHKRSGLLHRMEWYRVVLDEAHEIRNASTRYFRAAATLNTTRRWCLTGTPIQNKLEDLSSLADFLRLPPYLAKNAFQKHVLEPLSGGGRCNSEPLRAYLRSYCLRRTDKCLDVPPSTSTIIYLALSNQEQRTYDAILNRTKWLLDDIVSGKDTGTLTLYSVLFTATLKMRMMCNHGTLNPLWASADYLMPQHAEVDASCERCSSLESDGGFGDSQFCPNCRRPLQPDSPSVNAGGSPDPTRLLGDAIADTVNINSSLQTDLFSTKLKAVKEQVLKAETGTKHLIFSQWIPTLYGLVHIFRDAGVAALLVHGKTSISERTRLIRTFQEDPQASILIMSVGTGAVGLNLTAASHVHVVEPHWNPSVEAQAIARAVRMGQTKNVLVTRYIMKRTVEDNIVALQTKKQKLAKLTFDTGDGVNDNLEDFKAVLGVKLD